MRKILALALALAFAAAGTAQAGNRATVYPSQNPSSVQVNLQQRYDRLTLGNYMRDAFGVTNGTYGDLTISPGTGLYVTVAPTIPSSQGTVYQIAPDDPNPLPVGFSPNLPADTTPIEVEGTTSSASAPLGPLTAPGSGLSTYYLIEAQVQTVDTNPQTLTFVNSSGQPYTQTLDTERADQVVYQVKAGTAASSPTVPATDSGWVSVGTVLVPSGASQITSGMIAQQNPCGPGATTSCLAFSGFVQSANVVHLFPGPSPSPDVGNAGVTGTFDAGQIVSTAPQGTSPLTVLSTTLVSNLHAAIADALDTILPESQGGTGTATPTGVIPGASGNFTCSGAIFNPGQTCDVVASPSFTTVNASQLNATNATVSSLPSLACLGTNASGALQAGSCGGSSLTINGTAPITATQSSGIATIACPSCAVLTGNTYTGSEQIAPAGTATATQAYGSVGAFTAQNSTWNGSNAVTNGWTIAADSLSNLFFKFNGTSEATVSSTGALTLGTPLAIANGGTGSATQNFVDLSSAQTVNGVKTFGSAPVSTNGYNFGAGLVVKNDTSSFGAATLLHLNTTGNASGIALDTGSGAGYEWSLVGNQTAFGDFYLSRAATAGIGVVPSLPLLGWNNATAFLRPLADGSAAIELQNAAGTPQLTVNTTNGNATVAGAATATSYVMSGGSSAFSGPNPWVQNDGASVLGMAFYVPTSSTYGYRWYLGSTNVAELTATALTTSGYIVTGGGSGVTLGSIPQVAMSYNKSLTQGEMDLWALYNDASAPNFHTAFSFWGYNNGIATNYATILRNGAGEFKGGTSPVMVGGGAYQGAFDLTSNAVQSLILPASASQPFTVANAANSVTNLQVLDGGGVIATRGGATQPGPLGPCYTAGGSACGSTFHSVYGTSSCSGTTGSVSSLGLDYAGLCTDSVIFSGAAQFSTGNVACETGKVTIAQSGGTAQIGDFMITSGSNVSTQATFGVYPIIVTTGTSTNYTLTFTFKCSGV